MTVTKPVIPVVTFSDTLSSNSVIKRIDRPTFLTPRPVLKGEVKPAFALLLYARLPGTPELEEVLVSSSVIGITKVDGNQNN